MIYAYGVSLPGTYHIKKGIVCQDSHKFVNIGKDIAIAAVADGLGSAAHSDEGSEIAAHIATGFCAKHASEVTVNGRKQVSGEQILNIIRASFINAQRAIEKEARSKDRSIDLYDTTLTLAVLIRDTLYFGHSGDSGMIALTTAGSYEKVTTQQQDEQGRVFPLFFSDKWIFEEYVHKVASVLLATDGMLETFFPMYIRNEPVSIHVSLAQFFMDAKSLRIGKLGPQAVQERIRDFMHKIPDEQVNDDKTVAVLINTAVKTKRMFNEYYDEPDWAALKQKHDDEWRRAAYPGLYKETETQEGPPRTRPEDAAQRPYRPRQVQKPTRRDVPRKPNKIVYVLSGGLVVCLAVIVVLGVQLWGVLRQASDLDNSGIGYYGQEYENGDENIPPNIIYTSPTPTPTTDATTTPEPSPTPERTPTPCQQLHHKHK